MGKKVEVLLPKLGESIVSATVLQWFKQVGDTVRLDEPLLEVSTDKVNSEIPSPLEGRLVQILVEANQEVAVGTPLALLEVGAGGAVEQPPALPPPPAEGGFLSPAVMRLLQEKGIPLSEVSKIRATGEGGRLTKRDIEQYQRSPSCPKAPQAPSQQVPQGPHERVEMSPLRKAIAENMVRSFYQAPHASLITEVDVTRLIKKIEQEKEAFLKAHGAKLTITAFVAQALARAVAEYPLINASLDGEAILMKRFVNLGIAVSVDQGILVPVIRHCERLSLPEIAREIATLAEKARGHRLAPQDVQDGSITLTNFGMTGVQIGIPIIRYPEVAIVGLGAITKKVVPLADDTLAIRSLLHICLTFDHRILDGLYGCGFLNALKKHLEEG